MQTRSGRRKLLDDDDDDDDDDDGNVRGPEDTKERMKNGNVYCIERC
jgi:hypothetical protein